MTKLYVVNATVPMVILAESSEEAQLAGEAHARDEFTASYVPYTSGYELPDASALPPGWHTSSIPYGGDGHTTIAEYLAPPVVAPPAHPMPPFDVTAVAAMGQSLGEGYVPPGVDGTTLSVTQPYANLMLRCDSAPAWPVGGGGQYSAVPLTEPMRPGLAGDNVRYPQNLAPGSEPPTTQMVNTVSRLWRERGWGDYVFGAINVAIGGASITHIRKSGDWRSYAAALEEVAIFKRLCDAQGKRFGVACVVLTHGEADAKMPSPQYRDAVVALYDAFDADCRALTGQYRPVIMLASQQSSLAGGLTGSPVQLLDAAALRPGKIVVTGPKYELYRHYLDGKHLDAAGYRLVGEQYAKVYEAVVTRGEDWKPLQLRSAAKVSNTTVRIVFDVPTPPIAWDDALPPPWASAGVAPYKGRGFEVRTADGAQVRIDAVTIEGADTVRIDLHAASTGALTCSYATTGTMGHLRDSDLWIASDGTPLPNYAVHAVIVAP